MSTASKRLEKFGFESCCVLLIRFDKGMLVFGPADIPLAIGVGKIKLNSEIAAAASIDQLNLINSIWDKMVNVNKEYVMFI